MMDVCSNSIMDLKTYYGQVCQGAHTVYIGRGGTTLSGLSGQPRLGWLIRLDDNFYDDDVDLFYIFYGVLI
jgi:hypothetical protein